MSKLNNKYINGMETAEEKANKCYPNSIINKNIKEALLNFCLDVDRDIIDAFLRENLDDIKDYEKRKIKLLLMIKEKANRGIKSK